jgi:hypothetical protein
VKCIAFFTAFATFITHVLEDQPDEAISPYVTCPDFPTLPIPFPEARSFCTQELHTMLKNNWSRHGDEYFVVRGKTAVEVVVEVGTLEEEREGLLKGVGHYLRVVGRLRVLQSKERIRHIEQRRVALEELVL